MTSLPSQHRMKLSKTQLEVIVMIGAKGVLRLVQDLRFSRYSVSRFTTSDGVTVVKYISSSTVEALFKKGLLKREKYIKPYQHYSLTELGKTIKL